MSSLVVHPGGAVNRAALDAVRDHLKAAKVDEVLAAIGVYDFGCAAERRLHVEGHQAHRLPTTARQRHHDLVVSDLLAGRTPDDERLWLDVEAADAGLELAKARVAAARDCVERAGRALGRAFAAAWPQVLPYIAKQRASQPAGLDELYQSISWPALVDPPGVETPNTSPATRFARWWPLALAALDPRHHRRDRSEWNEWCWAEIAAGRYDTDGASITLTQRWTPPRYSTITDEAREQALRPVVFITPERVDAYARSLEQRR